MFEWLDDPGLPPRPVNLDDLVVWRPSRAKRGDRAGMMLLCIMLVSAGWMAMARGPASDPDTVVSAAAAHANPAPSGGLEWMVSQSHREIAGGTWPVMTVQFVAYNNGESAVSFLYVECDPALQHFYLAAGDRDSLYVMEDDGGCVLKHEVIQPYGSFAKTVRYNLRLAPAPLPPFSAAYIPPGAYDFPGLLPAGLADDLHLRVLP